MGDLKFVPQSMLDLWADLGKIELTGTTLRLPSENLAFQLTPAVRFVTLLEGEDTHKLLQKVKAEAFVRDIGGEVITDSCIVGETAYQVQPGFLAEVEALEAAKASRATKKPPPRPAAAPASAPASAPTPAPARAASAPAAARPVIPPTPTPTPGPAPRASPDASAAKAGAAGNAKAEDTDLLTRFLLESLE